MPFNDDERKESILRQLAEAAASLPPVAGVDVPELIRAYYRHVPVEDLDDRSQRDLGASVFQHLQAAKSRPQGTAVVRVFTPSVERDGWSASDHTVATIVTDDMPFLVDSVTMALTSLGHDALAVIHPQFVVRRDIAGDLVEIISNDEPHESSDGDDEFGVIPESWMHIEIAHLLDEEAVEVRQRLEQVLQDVREAVEDWKRMRSRIEEIVEELNDNPPPLSGKELNQDKEFLTWLAANHFTFLGYREYDLTREGDQEILRAVPGTGLGILRGDSIEPRALPPKVAAKAREKTLLVLAKANSLASVHRPVHLDYIGIKRFDANGEVNGERRFLGLFSSAAYTESVGRIPLVREKAQQVLDLTGFSPDSHDGKEMLDVLETLPRDELFQTPVGDLATMVRAVAQGRDRRRLRLFLRPDVYGQFVSALVYLPRDRYNTTVRQRIESILKDRLGGESVEFTARISESVAARLHFVVRPPAGQELNDVDLGALEEELTVATRSWTDDLAVELTNLSGSVDDATRMVRIYGERFPEAYKEDYSPATGARDLERLLALPGDALDPELEPGADGMSRLKLFRTGGALSLSQILPILTNLGVEVIDERPYALHGGIGERDAHIYDFGIRSRRTLTAEDVEPLHDAIRSVWDGRNESDPFNALVLDAGLTWRQATVLRAYARYLQQAGTPYSQDHIATTLSGNVDIARHLVRLFENRFDPGAGPGVLAPDDPEREQAAEQIRGRIETALDEVSRLDQDRVLRGYLELISATLRTNYYQVTDDGQPHPYLSLKLDPKQISELPEPRPRFEIFVYSPRVEGVHLRFGYVARGGLRWSDRRDDFRTEILGLVKAQMVKNTVIVPVGAKGGFVCKQLPDPSDREAWMAEGIACYRTFISALLDVTDNLVDVEGDRVVVPPARVVRHDGDDTYLVVAADKGTATFSDIANAVSADYGFWLGDAFASGGSVGYDHKAMGITAKGAWVSVERHFRDMGVNTQQQDFTVVGIGDMSGDVFGNGMLCSPHIRLVAAFDHRDIFLDPNPDSESSYAERERLFQLPRSSWQDYDRSLISEGGGVHSRSAKSIPISAEVREALGLADDVTVMSPPDLMRAILLAPVDLLWNGGIGTYVKSAGESNADAGDKANDAIRVDGADLRCKSVGEGGNLGFTQRGRIEYAREGGPDGAGGRLNTDFIDNSAGVDTSDHEVNIKILLDLAMNSGALEPSGRADLLAQMTDEVGLACLADNYDQNLALANALAVAPALAHVHEYWMHQMEKDGLLDRVLEALPSSRDIAGRIERGEGLSAPELAVLLSYAKISLANILLESDISDDPYLRSDLYSYFPRVLRQDYRGLMDQHPLRREIVVTKIVNDLINNAGITYLPRLTGETGASIVELTRANFIAREIFGTPALQRAINLQDNKIAADCQTRMRLEVRTLAERVSRWLVSNYRAPLDSEGLVDHFEVVTQRVLAELPDLMTGAERDEFVARRDALTDQGVPEELAVRVAVMQPAYMVLGIVENALRDDVDPMEVARVHFAVGERLGLPALVQRILALPRTDRWRTMARAALRDDVHTVAAQLDRQVMAGSTGDAAERVSAWEADDAERIDRATQTIAEITSDENADLARLSVGLRVVRSLLSG